MTGQAPGTEPREKGRRGRVRNPDSSARGAQRRFQPRFRRSMATPDRCDVSATAPTVLLTPMSRALCHELKT
ncbi:hypothetical protein NDU88_007029 [Pleurodeles waltl]|uniref:Uncharacterized protein n=1 Tax=Pleurodeles waltl TaxID=8319 RepID=A0AAV7PLC2_PLEWA|nr:hypothetical protein NDU88_007029 [Pleurodeles waltl]